MLDLPLPHPGSLVSEKRACMHNWSSSSCGCCPEATSIKSLALVANGACVHGYNRIAANKETVISWLSPQGSVQGEQTEMPISQSS